jgi:hypothetical protein
MPCHFAIELLCTRGTNSPGRRHLGPTEHATPNSPNQRHRAAQNAQSVQHVPMHLHAAWPRSAPEPARHDTPDAMTTLLIPVEHHIDPAAHHFPGLTTVGDIPNRYTSEVVLNQQARVAHQGWYGGFAIPGGPVAEVATAVLDAGAYGGSSDRPGGLLTKAHGRSGDGPWRVTLTYTHRT